MRMRQFKSQQISRLIVSDIDNHHCFHHVFLDLEVVQKPWQDVDAEVGKIQNAMGSGIDVSFDCVGFDKTMSTALNATRAGGKVCLIGLAKSEMTVALTPAAAR